MSDSILKQQEIAAYIGNALNRIRAIEKYLKGKVLQEENANYDAPQDGQRFLNPYVFFACEVTSVVDDTNVVGKQTKPTTTGWEINTDLTSFLIPMTVPDNVTAPSVGDQVMAHFTGTYTDASSVRQARYGIFGAGGGASLLQTQIQSVGDDHLVVQTLAGSTLGGTDILVAKSFMTRKTPFDGNTVNGISYVYSTAVDRVATIASSTGFKQVETVIPRYNVGDVIYAQQVSTTIMTITVGSTPQGITYLDTNNDNRNFVHVAFST